MTKNRRDTRLKYITTDKVLDYPKFFDCFVNLKDVFERPQENYVLGLLHMVDIYYSDTLNLGFGQNIDMLSLL